MLYGWDPALPVDVYCDASGKGAGCYICQKQGEEVRPLFYDSFTFTPTEQKYDTYKRELRAIVKFADKHQYILRGPLSTIHTDHKPLVNFLNSDPHEDVFARWAIKLRVLNIRIQYVKGERNQAADGLSRTVFNKECTTTPLTMELAKEIKKRENEDPGWFSRVGEDGYEGWMKRYMKAERDQDTALAWEGPVGWTSFAPYDQDKEIEDAERFYFTAYANVLTPQQQTEMRRIRREWYYDLERYFSSQRVPEKWTQTEHAHFKRKAHEYRWDGKRLLHQVGERWVPCIGPEEVAPMLQSVHDEGGHFSSKNVIDRIRHRVFWPGMAKDVRTYIQGCIECARHAVHIRSQPLIPVISLRPFALLAMDHIGPFPESPRGNTYILNIIDYFSRFIVARAVPNLISELTVTILKEIFSEYPIPIAIYTDRGSSFRSQTTEQFMQRYGILFRYAPTACKRSIGMIERANGILQERLERIWEREKSENKDIG